MSGAAVFAYHNFAALADGEPPSTHAYVLGEAQFLTHLEALGAPEFRASGLNDVLDEPEPGRFVLTFDDGHASNYTVAFPHLVTRGWPGCFFVVAGYIGVQHYLDWGQLREMAAAGMEIGCHSMTHPFLHGASAGEIRREFGESKKMIEDGIGQPVTLASLPRGSADPGMSDVIRELGYRAFCISDPGLVSATSDRFAVPRIAIKQRTSAAFVRNIVAGKAVTLATLRSVHAVKEMGKHLVGAERWRRVRGAFATATDRVRG